MMLFNELGPRAAKERVDMAQIWSAWLNAEDQRRHSFLGSLGWERRSGHEYLYRRKGRVVKSLGPRSHETEDIWKRFHAGRDENTTRLKTLSEAMNRQAAVLRALDLGRLPVTAARILRALRLNAPEAALRIVGTNALYAFEAIAGGVVSPDSTATGDIDILVDDRNHLKILTEDGDRPGVAALIAREVDKTFRAHRPGDFRLINDAGYMVEFIRPEPRPVYRKLPGEGSSAPGDVQPAPINGLQWLVHAPLVEAVVIDERGFPAPIRTVDPRRWAAHKLWLSQREDRDETKKIRDMQQAVLMISMIEARLPQFPLDEGFFAGLPKALRPLMIRTVRDETPLSSPTPRW